MPNIHCHKWISRAKYSLNAHFQLHITSYLVSVVGYEDCLKCICDIKDIWDVWDVWNIWNAWDKLLQIYILLQIYFMLQMSYFMNLDISTIGINLSWANETVFQFSYKMANAMEYFIMSLYRQSFFLPGETSSVKTKMIDNSGWKKMLTFGFFIVIFLWVLTFKLAEKIIVKFPFKLNTMQCMIGHPA